MKRLLIMITLVLANIGLMAQISDHPGIQKVLAKTNLEALQELADKFTKQDSLEKIKLKELASKNNWPEVIELEGGKKAHLVSIAPGNRPLYDVDHNVNAAKTISTDDIQPSGSTGYNLTGSGQIIGLWEAGDVPDTSHNELSGKITTLDVNSSDNHATHVAGTLVATGNLASAKGMAPSATIRAYDSSGDAAEMVSEAASGLILSNHSYGYVVGWNGNTWYGDPAYSLTEDILFGYYLTQSATWDELAYNAPYYLIVKSAGNDRTDVGPGNPGEALGDGVNDGGYDCLPPRSTCKNILTIGAVYDISAGYSQPSDVTMSPFSSWGPTDDGRIKPDIVANGISLTSSITGNTYGNYSGTSMSGPSVTGSVALLQEHYYNTWGEYPFSAMMKAIIIHTADEAGSNDGPDYENGWGLMNSKTAAQVIDNTIASILIVDTITNGNTITYNIQRNTSTDDLVATLVWTDIKGGQSFASIDPTDLKLINDLDLRLTENGNTYSPYVLDPSNPSNAATTGDNYRDNVEKVVVTGSNTGTYTVSITHKNTITNTNQAFALIITGATCPDAGVAISKTISSTTYSGTTTEVALKTITTFGTVTVNASGDVEFKVTTLPGSKGGESITLEPGFDSVTGSTFDAYIEECP